MLKRINNTSFMKNRRGKFKKRFPRANVVGSVVGKVFGLQKQIDFMKGMINSEVKYNDVANTMNPTTAGSIALVNQIAQGDDVNQRDGNSILVKHLEIAYKIGQNAASTGTIVRIIVFMDTAGQGSTPAVADYLQTVDTLSFKNYDNQRRFITIIDKRITLSITGLIMQAGKKYRKGGYHLRFSGSAANSVLQNACYLIAISNEAVNTPQLDYNFRTAYYDN